MPNVIIFYFSGTGNTYHTSLTIANQLTKRGLDTKAISIESINPSDVEAITDSAEIIGFGYPIYGSDIPAPMKTFIENFPVQKTQKRAFVFCTQLMFSGDGSFVYKKEIESKSLVLSHSAHINMPNNIAMFPQIIRTPRKTVRDRTVVRGDKKAIRFANAVYDNKSFYNGRYSYFLGIMQRGPYRKAYDKFTDTLSISKDDCIKCGRCVRLCPVKNISMSTDYPEFLGNCAQCMRCYNFCPTLAIMYHGKKHDPKYRVYKGPTDEFMPEQLKKRS